MELISQVCTESEAHTVCSGLLVGDVISVSFCTRHFL